MKDPGAVVAWERPRASPKPDLGRASVRTAANRYDYYRNILASPESDIHETGGVPAVACPKGVRMSKQFRHHPARLRPASRILPFLALVLGATQVLFAE